MKSKFALLFAAVGLLWLVTPLIAYAAVQASFYVDPVSGSDANNGTSSGTAFATLAKAQTAVEAVNSNMTGDIIVYLMPGDYVLTTPLTFTEADSGTNGHDVVWTAYGARGSARILGGTKVTGWVLDSGNIYKAPVTAGAQRFEAVFENGVRGVLARHPNSGYWSISAKDSTYPKKKFQWNAGNSMPSISTPTDVQVLVWPGNHDWSTEIHNVASMNYSTRWITLTENLQLTYLDGLDAGSRYYIQGAKELLDQPGEFYYDASAGYLYYYPRNTPIASQEIIVPTLSTLVQGAPTTGTQTLTASWQFEDDTSDSSSVGNDGTEVNSPGYVTSQTGLGDAISLDGSTQYVTVPDDTTLQFGSSSAAFSIAAWIKTSGSGYQPIVCKARPGGGQINMDYRFWLTDTGLLQLRRWNQSSSTAYNLTDSDGSALNDGTWHHVVFVNESSTSHKLYIDGSLAETSTDSWTQAAGNSEPVEIGRSRDAYNNVTYYFDGEIDDARVYQSALGSGDVYAIYQKQALSSSALEHLVFLNLKFAGANFDYTNPTSTAEGMIYFANASHLLLANNEFGNGSTGIRFSGGDNLSVTGNTITDMALAGVFASSISDSTITNNRIRNTAQFFADGGANIRIDSVTNVEVSHNNLATSKRHGIRMRASTGNTISYNEVTDMDKDSQDTGAIYWGYSDYNTVTHNRVHDSGDSFGQQHGFYVEDGSDHTDITNNIVYNIGNAVSNTSTAPINVKGVYNLIQNNIFDYSKSHSGLRTAQILSNAPANHEQILYNIFYSGSTSTTHYYFQGSYQSNRISQSDYNTFHKSASGSNIMHNIPGDDTLSHWKTIQSNQYDQHSTTADPGFVDAANHNYAFTAGAPTGFNPIDTSEIGLLPEFVYPDTAGQWIFSADTTDLTLNGHDGTQVGGSFVADRFGTAARAINLNGTSDYVNIPDDSALDFGNPSQPFTIVAWVKTSGTSEGIVAKGRDTNTPNMDYRLQVQATGAIEFTRWNQATSTTDTVIGTLTINDGNWHHVAFVNEGDSSHKIYIDGVLDVTSTTTWTNDDSNNEPVRIGRDRNGTTSDTYFSGIIDDVAILASALTADDIKDLNHQPHP